MTALCAMIALVLSAAAPAATPVQVATVAGETIEGVWSGLDSSGAILLDQEGVTKKLSPSDLMSLRWLGDEAIEAPAAQSMQVFLADGSRFRAKIIAGGAKHLTLATGLVPELRLPLAQISAVRFSTQQHEEAAKAFRKALTAQNTTQDVLLIVRDGRVATLRGVTESLGPDGGSFKWRSRTIPLRPDNAFGIVFASGVGKPPVPQVRCELRNGSVWGGRLVAGDLNSLELELTSGLKASLPISDLREIRFQSDRVTYLSDLEPSSYEFEPFSVTRWPYRPDRSVANRPIRISQQSFERGIGMHSQAKLTYELPDGFSNLSAIIGIDEAVGTLGNVVFRVLADGKEVFNSGPVTGKDEPRSILVPITGAKQITLCVDYGEDLDIGDQANWANARLIK